jgi:hypothetical protein
MILTFETILDESSNIIRRGRNSVPATPKDV